MDLYFYSYITIKKLFTKKTMMIKIRNYGSMLLLILFFFANCKKTNKPKPTDIVKEDFVLQITYNTNTIVSSATNNDIYLIEGATFCFDEKQLMIKIVENILPFNTLT